MDEWLNYLYLMGALNNEDGMENSLLKDLVYEYNSKFPDNPLNESFFFDNTEDEQIRLLREAITNYVPIRRMTR